MDPLFLVPSGPTRVSVLGLKDVEGWTRGHGVWLPIDSTPTPIDDRRVDPVLFRVRVDVCAYVGVPVCVDSCPCVYVRGRTCVRVCACVFVCV